MQKLDSIAEERILVTGAGGVLGTAILSELRGLLAKDVIGITRKNCDLMDSTQTIAVFKEYRPSVVFHLAGWVAGVGGNAINAGRAYYENSMININVIEAARLCGAKKVVAAGTTAIYSDDTPRPMLEKDVWFGIPHESEEAYAVAKRGMLTQLKAYKKQYGLDYAFMICTNLYGENDRFDEKFGHVIPSLISRFDRLVSENATTIDIWGDGSPTRDFLYSRDAARAFIIAALYGEGSYNTATGNSVTIREMVQALSKAFSFDGNLHWDVSRPNGQRERSYDVSRLKALGWKPDVSLEEGLRRTINWFRDNRSNLRR